MQKRRAFVVLEWRLIAALCATNATSADAGPAIVQVGEYLATAGDCISCHTADGGQPFAGGYRINKPFGYLLAPNITPDPETGIGRWTADEFYRMMHTGISRDG